MSELVNHDSIWRSSHICQTVHPAAISYGEYASQVSNASKGASPADISAACRTVSAVPALLIVGEKDRVAPSATNVARLLAHSRLSILPACGHLSHEETPRVLVGSLGSFVRETLQGLSAGP